MKLKHDWLEKKLKGDKKFNAFNKEFDYKYIIEECIRNKLKINESTNTSILLSSPIFNKFYRELYPYIFKIYNDLNIDKRSLKELLISLINRDFHLISFKVNQKIHQNKEFDFEDIYKYTIKSVNSNLNDINASGGIEAQIDALQFLLKLIESNEFPSITFNEIKNKEYLINESVRSLLFANLYAVIKTCYDIAVWENCTTFYNKTTNEIHISYINKNIPILNIIGKIRLEKNISIYMLYSQNYYENDNYIKSLIDLEFKKHCTAKRLKSINIENNCLKYKIADGIDKAVIEKQLRILTIVTGYYSFIGDVHLPKLSNLTLHNLFHMYSEISHLFELYEKFLKSKYIIEYDNLNKFLFYIKLKDLKEYLKLKTKFNKDQISDFLNLLISSNEFDLWKKPLIKMENDNLSIILLPLLFPNYLLLIDYWLLQGGFDLDERGVLFENHVKNELRFLIGERKYFCHITDISKIRVGNIVEQIDLIIELSEIIIIAELKCIKFPSEARDHHNTLKRITDGVNQINRKKDFFIENYHHISQQIGLKSISKAVFPIVIVNYPHYSGLIIDNIPIIDFSLLENYISSGAFIQAKMHFEQKRLNISEEINSKIVYYKNEKEFNNNFFSYLLKPTPIYNLIDKIEITKKPMINNKDSINIFMEYVDFKEEIQI